MIKITAPAEMLRSGWALFDKATELNNFSDIHKYMTGWVMIYEVSWPIILTTDEFLSIGSIPGAEIENYQMFVQVSDLSTSLPVWDNTVNTYDEDGEIVSTRPKTFQDLLDDGNGLQGTDGAYIFPGGSLFSNKREMKATEAVVIAWAGLTIISKEERASLLPVTDEV